MSLVRMMTRVVNSKRVATAITVIVLYCVCSVTQSCPTLYNPMDCSSPGSSVHGIFQARMLEWAPISSSRGTSWPRDQTWSGTRVCCQLVFCMNFCVWRSIPDVSMERDVLHIHLLLRCLVLHIVLYIEPKPPVNSICPLNSILHWGKKKTINETILLFNEGYLRKLYICCFIKSFHP